MTVTATTSTSETDSTRTVGDTVRGSKQQPKAGSSAATIRHLFRQTLKALTSPETAMPKKSRRRSGDDTTRRFIRTANRVTRLRTRAVTAFPWLADTLDWLNLWQPGSTELPDDLSQAPPNNHLSPRL